MFMCGVLLLTAYLWASSTSIPQSRASRRVRASPSWASLTALASSATLSLSKASLIAASMLVPCFWISLHHMARSKTQGRHCKVHMHMQSIDLVASSVVICCPRVCIKTSTSSSVLFWLVSDMHTVSLQVRQENKWLNGALRASSLMLYCLWLHNSFRT